MSIDQANAFRTFVNENESVQEQIKGAASDDSFSLVALAAEHGYTFTAEDAQSAWDAAQEGELSDFELEVVSGGYELKNVLVADDGRKNQASASRTLRGTT